MKKSTLKNIIKEELASSKHNELNEGMFSRSPNAKTLLEGLKTQFQIAFEAGVEAGGYDDFEKGFWRFNSNEILYKIEEILNR